MAKTTARATGRPLTFAAMTLLVVAWALCGPLFHYSDTWQLTINTGTTIVTFLMVFLIQATQNRDADAIQIKLDEIIRSLDTAHNSLLDLEELEEDDLMRMRQSYLDLAERARTALKRGTPDTGVPAIGKGAQEGRNLGGERRAR
ncbi:MAG TPA: low affinity iron permease family protein [Usitatibacter sp.]|jgi:low affinity Fe/Cu permease|nr:low affinity iron permease family protein [Usitatibacter sp.]